MPISRRTLIERIDRFLRSIEKRHIEPGRWEAYCAKKALEALTNKDIERGEALIDFAKMPPELRTSSILPDFSPANPSSTLAELRAEFERLKEAPEQGG
jgi:hypothetical protein